MNEDELTKALVDLKKEVINIQDRLEYRLFSERFWQVGGLATAGTMLVLFTLAAYFYTIQNYPGNLPMGLFLTGLLVGVYSLFVWGAISWIRGE